MMTTSTSKFTELSNSKSNVLYYTSGSPSHPAPLSHLYHATASRILSTLLPTTPTSTITDVDSAYCPQCLTSWDGSTAFSTAKGRCMKSIDGKLFVGCVSCPECRSALTVSVLDTDFFGNFENDGSSSHQHLCVYKCGYCHWDSTECGVFQSFNVLDDVGTAESIKIATKLLQEKLTDKLQTREETKHFEALEAAWLEKSNQAELAKRRASMLSHGKSSHIANDFHAEEKKTCGKWDVESLEESIRQRREKLTEQVASSVSVEGANMNMSFLRIGDDVNLEEIKPTEGKIINQSTEQQAWQQIISTSAAPQSPLPIPIALRARAVRRCHNEVESGRPGILVKPKVNPLEGDTSLRYGHGQWFKKDSSAIHSIPRVQIKSQRYNSSTNQYALLLKVKNPTLGPIRFQIHANFVGESAASFPSFCDLVLDSMSLKREIVRIIPPPSSPSPDLELLTLEASEDTFLDINKDSNAQRIDTWTVDDLDWSTANRCQLIGVDNDTAWIQVVVKETEEEVSSNDRNYVGTPLILDIEVGEESWESSLIRARELKEGEKDFVSFTILPVWKQTER